MTDVTLILSQIESGDPLAAEQLLPLVYAELRKLAATKLAQEKPGQTLQATALVHDAYIRLVDVEKAQHWNSRGHFFGAAAEAMRRILVENARRKQELKHGGGLNRVDLDHAAPVTNASPEQLMALDDAIRQLDQNESMNQLHKASTIAATRVSSRRVESSMEGAPKTVAKNLLSKAYVTFSPVGRESGLVGKACGLAEGRVRYKTP